MPNSSDPTSVFLSYPSPDRDLARGVADALRSLGFSVFFDEADLVGGEAWGLRIRAAISRADSFVTLLTSNSRAAHYQQSEAQIAIEHFRRRRIRIVPVLVDLSSVPLFGLEQLHLVRVTRPVDPAGIAEVAAAALSRHAPPQLVDSSPVDHRVLPPPQVFRGRTSLIARVKSLVADTNPEHRTVALQGLPGVGKTSLVRAIIAELASEFDPVWWVNAESSVSIVDDLVRLGQGLEGPGLDRDDALNAAQVFLRRSEAPWLLVFDNVPDEHSIAPWLSNNPAGRTLITTQNRNLHAIAVTVEVPPLERDASVQLLEGHLRRADHTIGTRSSIRQVAERLAGHPLALTQAAAWVARGPHRGFPDFLELLEDRMRDPFPDQTRPAEYPHTAFSAMLIAEAAAHAEAPSSRRVLAALSYLQPDDVPLSMLLDSSETLGDPDAALAALHGYSLVNLTSTTVSTHRVVQEAARRADQGDTLWDTIRIVRSGTPSDPDDGSTPLDIDFVARNVVGFQRFTPIPSSEDDAHDLWWLLDDAAGHAIDNGEIGEAVDIAEISHRLALDHFDAADVNVAGSQMTLGRAYENAGRFTESIAILRQAVAARELQYGPADPETIHATTALASALESAGDAIGAIALYEEAASVAVESLGEDHPATLAILHNISFSLQSAGRVAEAVDRSREVLDRMQQASYPVHERLQASASLATALRNAGRLVESIAVFDETIAGQTEVLGGAHPETLESRTERTRSLEQLGRYPEAITELEDIVGIAEEIDDVSVRFLYGIRHDLATSYGSAGQPVAAVDVLRDLVRREEQLLGPLHRDVLVTLHNLGVASLESGDTDASRSILREVVDKRVSALGSDHADVQVARVSLAAAIDAAGDPDEAVRTAEPAVAALARQFDPTHPDLLSAQNDLAFLYDSAGMSSEAMELWADIWERAGEQDQTLRWTVRHNVATLLAERDSHAEGIAMLREVLEERRAALGPTHVDTLETLINLASLVEVEGADEADRLHESAVALCTRSLGDVHPTTLRAEHNRAAFVASLPGGAPRGATLTRSVHSRREQLLGPTHPDTLATALNLGLQLRGAGEEDKAVEELTRGRQLAAESLAPGHSLHASFAEALQPPD